MRNKRPGKEASCVTTADEGLLSPNGWRKWSRNEVTLDKVLRRDVDSVCAAEQNGEAGGPASNLEPVDGLIRSLSGSAGRGVALTSEEATVLSANVPAIEPTCLEPVFGTVRTVRGSVDTS